MSKRIHGLSVVDFELQVALKFRNKYNDAKSRNLDFSLTLTEFRKLLTTRNCQYTGLPMIFRDTQTPQSDMDMSIERIDNTRGYVSGNCIAICKAANAFKSVLENPSCTLTVDDGIRMFATIAKHKSENKF